MPPLVLNVTVKLVDVFTKVKICPLTLVDNVGNVIVILVPHKTLTAITGGIEKLKLNVFAFAGFIHS